MSATGYVGKTTNQQREVVGAQTQGEREDQWGEMPGEVVAFDAATQTATIRPLYKPRHNGEPVDMPDLLEVPVRFPRAGGGAFTMPVRVGDKLTLRPQMRSSENYHAGEEYTASDARSFNLSDVEAFLDGGEALTEPIENFDGANMHLRADPAGNYGLKASESGKFSLIGSEGNVYTQIFEGFDQCQQMAALLATEPELIHTAEYDAIATALQNIVTKLNAMAL